MTTLKIAALLTSAILLVNGCAIEYESYFSKAIASENFVGAKELMQEQIANERFLAQSPEMLQQARAKAYYKLSYAHGRLAEYDSMTITLEACIRQDRNFTKARREIIEFFSISEFNNAVFLYNNFFFDKAISKLQIAIRMVGTDPPYEEYAAVIFRCLAYAEASNNNLEKALDDLRNASQLGDALSKKILTDYEKERKIKPPEKLEPREKPSITI